MVAEKRPPALRRWPKAATHIPSDRRLSDLEAKLEQLTMNAWRAPESICAAHLANERAQLNRTFGLPTRLRDRQRQYARKPARCQRTIVSGLTIAIAPRTEGNQR